MTPTEKVIAALADHGCEPRQYGSGWSAKCPVHDDRRPSLSIGEGDDGRALLDCKKGCPTGDVVAAVGLEMSDLFPAKSTTPKPRSNGKPARKTFATAREAIATLDKAMVREQGWRVAYWPYHDCHGDPVAVVCRYDLPTPKGEKQQKTFRPVARRGDAWIIGGMPEPRPLYCLPDLADAERVYITEGEKAADAARAIGLTATTSAHGSRSPEKTDWSPNAGRECVLLPDQDKSGSEYTEAVASILTKLTPSAAVKLVELPDLPDKGDVADFVDLRRAAGRTDAEIKAEVEALADKAEAIQPDRPTTRIDQFRPFPTDALPEPVRGFVIAGAKALGCDESFLGVPMLSVLAAAIGNTRLIQLKRGWTEPAIIWTAIVGDSGTLKSPALELILKPTRDLQRKALAEYIERINVYRDDLLRYERDLAAWKRSKSGGDDPPEKPEEPIAERYWCDDQTTEALAVLLMNQPRGLLMARDELAGWLGGFDRYSKAPGGDVARWLEMFGGRSMVVDRKSANGQTLYVPRAAVSVCGGVQLEVLRRCLVQQYRDNGLAARLLPTCPPRKAKRWTDSDIDPERETAFQQTLNRLYSLQPATGDNGEPRPVTVGLTPDAKQAWVKFYNDHATAHAELSGDLSAAWSKLEGYAARFSLVIHYARWAATDREQETLDAVDRESIEAGIRLSRWFGHETRRIYSLLDECDESRERRHLVERIQRKGRPVTARDLMRSSRKWETATEAEAALNDLVTAKFGQWVDQPPSEKGGRPTRVFKLAEAVDVDTTGTEPDENGGSVNVNGVNTADDEWGEL